MRNHQRSNKFAVGKENGYSRNQSTVIIIKVFFFLVIFVLTSEGILFSQESFFSDGYNIKIQEHENQEKSPEESHQDLQMEKARLEISKLRQELKPSFMYFILKSPLIPLLIGIIGGLIAVINVTRTLSLQRKQHREERIADLLDKLGSDQESIRLGAAQALARYPKESMNFLLNQLRMDISQQVRMGIAESLIHIGANYFSFLRSSNLSAQSERFNLVAGLYALKIPEENVANIMQIELVEVKRLSQRPGFKNEIENWRRNESIDALDESKRRKIKSDLSVHARRLQIFISELTKIISKALQESLRQGKKITKNLTDMDLRLINFREIIFERVNFSDTNLHSALMSRAVIVKAEFIRNILKFATLTESKIKQTLFRKCNLTKMKCYDSKVMNVSFRECKMTGTNFSSSNFNSVNFVKCSSNEGPYFNGCEFAKCKFNENKFPASEFKGSRFAKSNLSNSEFWRAQFISAKMKRINFKSSKLGGADFTGADLIHANLENADIGGANFSKVKLWKANLKGVNLDKTNLFGADIRNVKGLSIDQLLKVKTLYEARMDSHIRLQVEEKCDRLLKEP